MKLNYGVYESKAGKNQHLYLKLFETTELIKPCFVEVATLREFMQHGILTQYNINLHRWDNDGKFIANTESFTLKTLIKECPEVNEYARQFFPELAI